ncbi:MAG: c-type cytochrome [Armatimonadota bacterium]|nr:c-type cytochrome [Armatimonadota bacterium]
MRRVAGWVLTVAGGLVVVLVVAASLVYIVSERRLNQRYAVTPAAVSVPADAASIQRGRHVALVLAKCGDCHGEDLGGLIVVDAPLFRIVGPNLTAGRGGVGARLTDADWLRAIRHGVGRDGRALLSMPSEDYFHMSETDLAAVVAYARSVPPVDRVLPASQLRFLGRVLLVLGRLPVPAAAVIEHSAPFVPPVPEGATLEYGRYLALVGCHGCHGPGLSGGRVPGAPREFPPASNITPAGAIGQWTEADFFRLMREGQRPDGAEVHPFMPIRATAQMTDVEIRALWMYLRSVPPMPYGNR